MAERPLFFDIYRLNIVDEGLLPFMGNVIRSDADIIRVLAAASDSKFDQSLETNKSTYKWGVREFVSYEIDSESNSVIGLTFARSLLTQEGQTVTDSSIENARSQFSPPQAETIHFLFYMSRHLVIVEYNSFLMKNQSWLSIFHQILHAAAASLDFQSELRLEPVPRQDEIITAFRSLDRLTRLRVKLRIPNPELDRRTERLRRDLVAGEIREYTQDMKNPRGLSQSEQNLPYATAAMAQAGYKDGEIILNGYRKNEFISIRTGKKAARFRLERLKDFIRGMAANAKSKETRSAVASIIEEVNRLAELPTPPEDIP